jgi:hypothetical protein
MFPANCVRKLKVKVAPCHAYVATGSDEVRGNDVLTSAVEGGLLSPSCAHIYQATCLS